MIEALTQLTPADVWFYTRQYVDLHPFLVPLGLIGLWRWGVWLLKEIFALFYRPQKNNYKASVSIVTPVYNENPKVFEKAVVSWAKNKPAEIIAVIDYTDKKCIEVFKKFAKTFQNAHLIITKIPGKRPALAEGIKKAKSDIVALVDSDTLWTDNVITNGLPPFIDKKVAGVGTYQSVLEPKTIAQKIFDTQLDIRYCDEFPFLSVAGDGLVCLSGRTAFYRKAAILPLLNALVNETFMGKPVISGDDKRLTYLVLEHGWKVAYQSNSRVYTPGMQDLGSYLKQRLRWTRNGLRADIRAILQGWVIKHPGLLFFQIDKVAQSFTIILSPLYFLVSLFSGLYVAAAIIFVWWFVSRTIKISPHLKRRPQDIVILPVFIIYTFLTAIIKIYAFFTLNTQGWITRWDKSRLPELTFLRAAPGYAATVALIILFTLGINAYKDYTYFAPRERQAVLVAATLPQTSSLALADTSSAPTVSQENMLVKRHVVKAGESLSAVAADYGVSLDNLLHANVSRIPQWNKLEQGTILSVPPQDTNIIPLNSFNYTRVYPDPLTIAYNNELKAIVVSGRGNTVTLSDIRNSVGEEYLRELSSKTWYAASGIYIRSGVTLILSEEEVKWLKLKSDKDGYVVLRAFNGIIDIKGVSITSWDLEKNDYDTDIMDGRSFVLVKDGSRLDLYNAEMAYLGFPRPLDYPYSSYGVSWRMSTGKLNRTLLSGEVINTKFHHNYFGAYTYGATGMLWRGNKFYSNIVYGLDPHDDSTRFIVENNEAFDNGSHGIIFSKRCKNNVIRNNISYNNKLHGIMLHETSDNNVIENNVLYGNTDGIAIWHSSKNVVRNNTIRDNKNGIRANVDSRSNLIENNTISNNSDRGIYLYEGAGENIVRNNQMRDNHVAVYIKTNANEINNNQMEGNQTGVYLLGKAADNKVVGNRIVWSDVYGVYSKIPQAAKNFLSNNFLYRNHKEIVAYEL